MIKIMLVLGVPLRNSKFKLHLQIVYINVNQILNLLKKTKKQIHCRLKNFTYFQSFDIYAIIQCYFKIHLRHWTLNIKKLLYFPNDIAFWYGALSV